MPYQAAKAIAATFCYNIRWALTPVFGNDFPSMCVLPSHSAYAKFVIDHDIVHYCTEETNRFRVEGDSYRLPGAKIPNELIAPKLHFNSPPWGPKEAKAVRSRASEEESGYCTESDHSDKFFFSPQVSPRSTTWTSLNRSQSPDSSVVFPSPIFRPSKSCIPPPCQVLPTSIPDGYYDAPLRTKRAHSRVAHGYDNVQDGRSSTVDDSQMMDRTARMHGQGVSCHSMKEIDAAEIMMQISTADRALPPPKRTRRGSYY